MTPVADGILDSIKKMLGISDADTAFDTDIIININSAFMILNQLGIGPDDPYTIQDKNNLWAALALGTAYEAVKTYIYMKVKMMFDPPTLSFLIDAYNRQITELEHRLIIQFQMNQPVPEEVPEEEG